MKVKIKLIILIILFISGCVQVPSPDTQYTSVKEIIQQAEREMFLEEVELQRMIKELEEGKQ